MASCLLYFLKLCAIGCDRTSWLEKIKRCLKLSEVFEIISHFDSHL